MNLIQEGIIGVNLNPGIRKKVTRAIADYNLIENKDKVVVGLSGGKDSILLLLALSEIKKISPIKFDLTAVTINIAEKETNLSPLKTFCMDLGIPHETISYPIIEIIKERNERSPCSLCSKLRNGILIDFATKNGFNKVALGHHLDDVVETVLLNLFLAGRFKCFPPLSWRSRKQIWVIRPLVYLSEEAIRSETKRLDFPTIKWKCPHGGKTQRAKMKQLIANLEPQFPALKSQILHALTHLREQDVWKIEKSFEK